jgi:ATPase subunit of ABC transporter with duplicated ATPase domains
VHAYLTRRTDRSGNETMTSGDKFSLTFPAPDRLDGVSSSTKTVLRVSSVTFAYPARAALSPSESGTQGSTVFAAADDSEERPDDVLKVVLRNVECRLTLKSKVAVLGGNGAGKIR